MPQPNAVKCLVVDDEPRLRRVLVRLLEGEGFTCAEAGSGVEALEMMQQDPVPLVISDLRMPQMDGVTLLRELLAKWPDTAVRVANYALAIARGMSLPPAALDMIALGAELHDIGKIGVRESVLHKPGKLSEAEYRHIMEHPVIGARVLAPLMRDAPAALAIVRSHHERLDGKGFPDGLKGKEVAIEVRVVTVADLFDAMTSVRPYRPALLVPKALQELEDGKAVQFDPEVVQAFLAAFPDKAALPVATPEVQPLHLPVAPLEARRG